MDLDTQINVTNMTDSEVLDFMKKNAISLKVSEVRRVSELLKRDPTLTEMHIFNTEWSEHCSYKSSRDLLKLLPTKSPTVMLGVGEDAGILKIGNFNGEEYGVAMSHESHNHPSQVVPFEGAATGIGGNVRDVLCMGAKVIACADPLRFGNPNGANANRTKYIANSVINGIAGYGNPIGVPVIAGDVYMNNSFDDNCLVNVVTLGLVKEKDIIHSACPPNASGYDVVLVGKATDNSGFGGAAFASLILDEEDEEFNKGAVQVPDPFLKCMLIRSTEAVFKEVREKNINIGFKDLGAGGVMCVTSELGDASGQGMNVELDKVHISMDIPPYVIACSETQERFCWVSPKEFTPRLLEIYNKEFDLPNVAEGAQASIIGSVRDDDKYVLSYKGKVVCDAPINVVTTGIKYDRESKENIRDFEEPAFEEPTDYNSVLLNVLNLPQIASKRQAYEHYDTEVQGNAVIRAGEADAGVLAPIPGEKVGIALSTDCNPRYSRINPKIGAINSVAESMRNVAAVGAVPIGMTDCLCYGNPEDPLQFWDFKQGVEGLAEATNNLWVKGYDKAPMPFVAGNVSFYNESTEGKSIDPSPIVACLGRLEDYSKAITTKIKKKGTNLYLVGPRKDELGGSAYYEVRDKIGKNVPVIDYELERGMIYGITDAIDKRLILSCHDISDGGVIVAVSEMILGKGDGQIGAKLLFNDEMKADKVIFSESSGFVFEVEEENEREVEKIFAKYNVDMFQIGTTEGEELIVTHQDKEIINLDIPRMKDAWTSGFTEVLE